MKPDFKTTSSTPATTAIVAAKPTGHEEHEAAQTINVLIWPAINFAIFFAIWVWIYRNKIAPVLVAKAAAFEKKRNASKKLLDDAKAEIEAVRKRKAALAQETKQIADNALADGKSTVTLLDADTVKQLQFMKQSLEKRITSETRAAEAEVRNRLIETAAGLSRNNLSTQLSADQDRAFREKCFQDFVGLVK